MRWKKSEYFVENENVWNESQTEWWKRTVYASFRGSSLHQHHQPRNHHHYVPQYHFECFSRASSVDWSYCLSDRYSSSCVGLGHIGVNTEDAIPPTLAISRIRSEIQSLVGCWFMQTFNWHTTPHHTSKRTVTLRVSSYKTSNMLFPVMWAWNSTTIEVVN